jgi:hypothetical protein
MGVLGSRHFTVPPDKRLEDCATIHSSNLMGPKEAAKVGRRPDRGPHITRIQEALVKLLKGAQIPKSERDNQEFGAATEEILHFFKKDRGIVNRSYQSSADAIIGQMTMRQLDLEMRSLELGEDVPIVPLGRQFQFVVPALPFAIKSAPDDASKQDLENKPAKRTATEFKARGIATIANGQKSPTVEDCKRMLLSIAGRGGAEAREMGTFFFRNSSPPPNFVRVLPNGSFLSNQTRNDPSFTSNHKKLTAALQAGLQELANQGSGEKRLVDVNRLREGSAQPLAWRSFATAISFAFQSDPSRLINSDPLAFAIGDIQGIEVLITSFKAEQNGLYEGTLTYKLLDHYGSDDGDIVDPGQASLWLLQRKMISGQSSQGFEPYRVSLVVEGVAFKGSLS